MGRTIALFRAGAGLTYLAAFLSLAVQLDDLIGPRGLLPLEDFLERLRAAAPGPAAQVHAFPTLFLWFDRGEAALVGVALAGAAIALMMIAGIGGRAVPIVLWFLYLSCITAGRDFFYYQWDNLLLETGFLAVFLPARGTILDLAKGRALPGPPSPVVFLLRWLLFRLLFESGLAKIAAGEGTWLDLSAMTYYYETAPLPSWGGWLVQQFPLWFHQASVIFTFFVEIVLPFFIFLPRRFRRAFFLIHVPFQASIALTSNYGFFNLLSAALGLAVLDDRDLEAAVRLPARFRRRPDAALPVPGTSAGASSRRIPRARRVLRLAPWLLVAAIVPASLIEALTYFSRDPSLRARIAPVHGLYASLRSVNVYHLFPGVLRQRIVAEIEGTADGAEWRPYRLRYAPSAEPGVVPPTTGLHNPRFPFHYSFLTLGRGQRDVEYLNNLVARLCCDPAAVADLFAAQPLQDSPPRALRFSFYRYRFGTRGDLRRTGSYWIREPLGGAPRPVACSCPGRP
ncbi:MAG: lipase maturation factor family protein [Acidobacteria bacterium]|nr:lipase maturation factor family protein [Acidobacteriota bacterium]